MFYSCLQGYQVSSISEIFWSPVAKSDLVFIAVTICRQVETVFHLCQFFHPFLSSKNGLLCCCILSFYGYASQFIPFQFLYSHYSVISGEYKINIYIQFTKFNLPVFYPCTYFLYPNRVINSLKAGTLFSLLSPMGPST